MFEHGKADVGDETLSLRPVKTPIVLVTIYGAAYSIAIFALAASHPLVGGISGVWELATVAGAAAKPHIGWGMGALITGLLAIYAIVLGGQRSAALDGIEAEQVRTLLARFAVLTAAAFVPPLLMVVAYCLSEPDQAGALFVVLPVASLMYFLSVQVGRFDFYGETKRIEIALARKSWAEGRLRQLGSNEHHPMFLVLVVLANTLVVSSVGYLVGLAIVGVPGPGFEWWLVLTVVPTVLALGGAYGALVTRTVRLRVERMMAWLVAGAVCCLTLPVAQAVFEVSTAPGLIIVGQAVVLALSTCWPSGKQGRPPVWTISGAASAVAARVLGHTLRIAQSELRELGPKAPGPNKKLSDRLRAAVRALMVS
ncbi:hypothetical protein [Georgenia alba]|uniref:Uncharacterized protein n=1 Tax=Georgenia alba TaxID=2233858 RepID=A0ABW2QB68_9MICO